MQYVTREHIDIAKWNECITLSPNGLIYGYSYYLDHMAKHWDALVYGDYEAVMPITWNRKYGIKYLYQPPFTQQLGIFSRLPLTGQLTAAFIHEIQQRFSFAEICLNYKNVYKDFKPRSNYILQLNKSYSAVSQGYKNILEKNLRRASHAGIEYRKWDDIGQMIELYKTAYGQHFPHVKKEGYERFEKLCFYLREEDAVVLRGAFDSRSSLLACVLLLKGKNRMYLLQAVTLPEGRTAQANHFLLDSLINEFSGDDIVLDFEGSSIPGIADFYKSFGAEEEPYFFYRYNRLPWPFKLFK